MCIPTLMFERTWRPKEVKMSRWERVLHAHLNCYNRSTKNTEKYFADDEAVRSNIKWLNSGKVCNTKKEPTHVSMITQQRIVISIFICIDLNIIQTSPSCLRDLKSLDTKPRLCLSFYLGLQTMETLGTWFLLYTKTTFIIMTCLDWA